MFKLKRKCHLIINNIFYFIFFILGFLIGGGLYENIKDIFIKFFDF